MEVSVGRRIALAILDDLTQRRGLRHEWDSIDPDVRDEIVREWARIADETIAANQSGEAP